MNRLIINVRESEKRIAVEKNGRVVQLYIEQPENKSLLNNIYLGIVEKVVPSMNAAFVQIGKGINGYLHKSQIPAYLLSEDEDKDKKPITCFIHQGEKIIVQVMKDETDSKNFRLTANIEFAGKAMVYMPTGKYIAVSKKLDEKKREHWKAWGKRVLTGNEGILVRTLADTVDEQFLHDELQALRKIYSKVYAESQRKKAPTVLYETDPILSMIEKITDKEQVNEIVCDQLEFISRIKDSKKIPDISIQFYNGKDNIFSHYHLDSVLEQVNKRIVWLSNGANIIIEETEACTVIDVNTGKSAGNRQKEESIVDTNLLAAKEIARQIQLRNIAGMILIDFINMKNKSKQETIIQTLKQEFQNDENRTFIYGFTSLGLLEMTRKRTLPSFNQKMNAPCPVCHGTGFVSSPATVAFELERELWEYRGTDATEAVIEATEDVISYFTGENEQHTKDLQELLMISLNFQPISFSRPHYHIKRWN